MITNFEFEKELNDRQLEAVLATDGPLLILAGAGSGKTRVLIYKIAWLIEQRLAKPNEILAVTFTNKAADEMKSRIAKMLPNCNFPYVNTFHSFCVKVLRASNTEDQFNIYDDSDKRSLLKDIIKQMDLDENEYSPAKISSIISSYKNRMQGPEDIEQTRVESMNLANIYKTYIKKMQSNNAFDFDDLIINGYRAFKNDDPFADNLRKKFKYILIDEYQDINTAQYMLVQEICRENKNITVVGDDDQSIYRFRGADMSIMLRFEKDYPDAKVVRLEQNYRSTGKILEAANALMTNNKMRKKKTLWTDKGDGEKINLMIYQDGKTEAHSVIMKIKELYKSNEYKYGDFAVLYRTNAQSRLFEEACRQEGIPYRIIGANSFYNAKEIKDITAYLHLVLNKKDNVAFKRIINVPKRGLGDSAVKRIEEYAEASEISLFEAIEEMVGFSAKQTEEIEKFIKLIKDTSEIAEQADAYTAVKFLIDESKIKTSFYNEDGELISAEYLNREANVDEFINSAQDYITTYADTSL
ncbi:UvrD-helicase domain-containing protein, partial [bacterium]|nr:UvrD-helicase domain-containing protein [bacterium]